MRNGMGFLQRRTHEKKIAPNSKMGTNDFHPVICNVSLAHVRARTGE
jgi:hypothetical protein